ncbi:unnamed protein product, partial [Lymnaea stagnalis]
LDDNCVCLEQPIQGKDLSTDGTKKEVSPEETDSKTESTVSQVLDQTEKSDPLQQNNNMKRKVDGERHTYLVPLLDAARTCLASASFLGRLVKHRLIEANPQAKTIILNAIIYHTYRNGTWSKAALHRDCSELGNFGVVCSGAGKFDAYSMTEDTFLSMKNCPGCVHSVHLVVFDDELYACGRKAKKDVTSKLFLFRGNAWKKVTEIPGGQLFLLSYNNSILVLNSERKIISSLKPKEMDKFQENFETLPENGKFEYALLYDSKLLVFLAENVEGIEETAVHCLDLLNMNWTKFKNLEGPAKHLISFQDGENHYVIQRNGNAWRLENTKVKLVSFHFIGKLWTSDVVLHGAVHYKDRLTLFGDDPTNYPENTESDLPDFPYSSNFWGQNDTCSNFLPVILAKSCLS